MNDYLWTLLLLLGYIILSLLGRKKKKRPPVAKPSASRSMEAALQDLLGYATPVPVQPEHISVQDVPFLPEPRARETAMPEDQPVAHASTAQPPIAATSTVINPWGERLRSARSARDAFMLSVIFGPPRAVRSPLRQPGSSH